MASKNVPKEADKKICGWFRTLITSIFVPATHISLPFVFLFSFPLFSQSFVCTHLKCTHQRKKHTSKNRKHTYYHINSFTLFVHVECGIWPLVCCLSFSLSLTQTQTHTCSISWPYAKFLNIIFAKKSKTGNTLTNIKQQNKLQQEENTFNFAIPKKLFRAGWALWEIFPKHFWFYSKKNIFSSVRFTWK